MNAEERLAKFFAGHPRVAVAFSGGVDSSYLLYTAKSSNAESQTATQNIISSRKDEKSSSEKQGTVSQTSSEAANISVRAYYVKSQFQPQFELDDAVRMAEALDVPLSIETIDILACAQIAENPPDRCYYCKKAILTKLWELARADGYTVLCDGTNADDDEADRHGTRALRELEVLSPLRECGLKKEAIRRLSKKAGLFTHDKPAYACLATRIPAGTAITEQTLSKIERAEDVLLEMGFSDFRVRVIPPGAAKLQFPEAQWREAAAKREVIRRALQPDFDDIVLDTAVR